MSQADTLQQRWDYLDGKKSSLRSRCEEYARWTLAFLFPEVGSTTENTEQQGNNDSIGARAVNHLANKVVTTLFRPQGPFFRLLLGRKQRKQIKLLAAQGAADDQTAANQAAALMTKIEAELSDVEQEAMEYLDMVSYRPQATYATQLLVATGNTLVYHQQEGPVQVFSLRDYCVVRDISGNVIEIMTRECKAFETFHPDVQVQLRAHNATGKDNKEYADKDDVIVYTQIKLNDDGKFYALQEAGCVELDTDGASWPKKLLPWIPLTWNLSRGSDYGSGLVEDYAGAFHAITVLTQALLNIAAIMGDIKFLVNPTSLVDVKALNESESGSYHSGKKDDVVAIELEKQRDAQFISTMIDRYEKQIASAFLLNSAVTRDAERVTAEEIRTQANELETSNGGIYSRLALQWQVPTANITLDRIGFAGAEHGIKPQIITGMDSLSRQGEMDNLRMFIADLALMNEVPENLQAAIDPIKFATVIGTARQVDYQKFLRTPAEMQAAQQQETQQAQQQDVTKAGASVAAEAGKQAVQQQG